MNIKQIVCVDDDRNILEIYDQLITSYGPEYGVATYHLPNQLLKDIDNGTLKVDLFLLDLMMPGMDGMAVMRELQKREITTPVIIVTGAALKETAIEALNRGAFALLEKPFSMNEVRPAIDRAIEYNNSLMAANRLLELQQKMIEKLNVLHGSYDQRLIRAENLLFEKTGAFVDNDTRELTDLIKSLRHERQMLDMVTHLQQEMMEIKRFFNPRKIWRAPTP
jgi:DNA-binding NtrC family response regulator